MFLIGSLNMIFEQHHFLVILCCCCISWHQIFHTLCFVQQIKPVYVIPDQVCCAVIRYHSRRVTCLEFHPTKNNILLSGDKKGQVGVWDFDKVHERMVYQNIHTCIVNNMRFKSTDDGMIYAASSDGTISSTDLETGMVQALGECFTAWISIQRKVFCLLLTTLVFSTWLIHDPTVKLGRQF
uniref:Uncharacterized protein n=1 Tax=Salix viminalis TaxID=40686 RepID=A0A6N2MI76_SALVM